MKRYLSNVLVLCFGPLLLHPATADESFPFAPGTLDPQGKLLPWSWQDVYDYRDKIIGDLSDKDEIWEKDNAAAPLLLGDPSQGKEEKTYKTTIDLTDVSGLFQIAIHVDDKALLRVVEIPEVGPPPSPDDVEPYVVDGTALWNKGKSYKEFLDYLPAGRKYTLYLTYKNTANLTAQHPSGFIDYDGVTVFLVLQEESTMKIYNGQGASNPVSEKNEETLGAFTVANLNDTDGDGTIDKDDDEVKTAGAIEGAVDEVDLMKLVVTGPNKGRMKISVVSGNVEFWEKSTKETKIGQANGAIFIDAADLPKTLWVEATNQSNAIRDIELKLGWEKPDKTLSDDLDVVKATAVWVVKDGFSNAGNNPPADLDNQQLINNVQVGLGLEELSGHGQLGLWGVEASMLMQFKVLPAGVGAEAPVKFDITRQKERVSYFIIEGKRVGPPDVNWSLNDLANDDSDNTDEDLTPKNDHIFALDAPKALLTVQGNPPPPDGTEFHYYANYREFARVSFNGVSPKGDVLAGSRCSIKTEWKTQQKGVKNNGVVVRDGPNNYIQEGQPENINP